ncbi:UNVERIFIED_CONTAM: hypothetical protein RMT77_013173 [Armadillidium vulgare]
MPKKDKKRGRKGMAPISAAIGFEDDETASVVSDATDSTVQQSDEENGVCEEEAYETKVKEAMDLATEKSVQTRTNALISLKIALQKRILTTFLCENHQTMSDLIERSLKKGRGMEQVAAAKLASVLVISLMGTGEAEQVYAVLHPIFVTIVQDPTVSPQARQEAAYSLSLVAFLACPEPSDLPSTLNTLHNVFCAALPKGNGELPNHSQSLMSLHAAALQGVCLLLTLLSHTTVYSMAPKMLEEFIPVLMTTDLDLKIMVGEAMALIYESAREHSEEFRWKKQGLLFEKFNGLVNESHKYKAKKDKKVQRATFREIMRTIKDGESISETVSVGPTHHHQELTLDTWALRFQYNMLCHALEQGLNSHMTNNPAVYAVLHPIFVTIVQDPTVSPQARQEAAYSLSLVAFLACPEPSDLPSTLNTLHNVFCAALPKGNGELPNHSQSLMSLHAAALQGVCLLLTLLSHTTVYSMAPKMLEEFIPVLMTTDLDLKIMVGEAMALIYESAREHSEEFRWKKQGLLFEKFNGLVNESHKYKAKKDKKVQRATFREIMRTIKDGESISETVSVGPTHHHQELTLDTWALRFQYNMLCHALEQGLNSHMTNNPALRDLFDLGPPPDPNTLKNHMTRNPKRPNRQTAEVKARILLRSKNRDNRAAALAYDD